MAISKWTWASHFLLLPPLLVISGAGFCLGQMSFWLRRNQKYLSTEGNTECSTQPGTITEWNKPSFPSPATRLLMKEVLYAHKLALWCQYSCGLPLTVKHVLVECSRLHDVSEKYFMVSSIKQLFDRANNHNIVDFITKIHFCSHL